MLWNPITLTIAAVLLLLLLLMLLLSLHGSRIVAVTAIAKGEVTLEEKYFFPYVEPHFHITMNVTAYMYLFKNMLDLLLCCNFSKTVVVTLKYSSSVRPP